MNAEEMHQMRHREVHPNSHLVLLLRAEKLIGLKQIAELALQCHAVPPAALQPTRPVQRGGRAAREVLLTPSTSKDGDKSATSSSRLLGQSSPLAGAEQRAMKRAARAEKSTKKALKNQKRYVVTVRQGDIDRAARTIHGDIYSTQGRSGHPLITDTTLEDVLQENLGFALWNDRYRPYLKRLAPKDKRPHDGSVESKPQSTENHLRIAPVNDVDKLVSAVLVEFGSTPAASERPSGRSEKASLLQRFTNAIGEDVQKHDNEMQQTRVRAGGYWDMPTEPCSTA